jgi:hypothetical protein
MRKAVTSSSVLDGPGTSWRTIWPAASCSRIAAAERDDPTGSVFNRHGGTDLTTTRSRKELTMPLVQFTSAQAAQSSTVVADFGSELPINFSGQVVGASPGVIGQPSIFSVGGWISLLNPNALATIFSVANQFSITVNGGQVTAGFTGGSSVISDIAIDDSDYHYIACSFLQDATNADSGVLELYIDGSHTASGDVTGASSSGAADCALGDGSGVVDAVSWCFWSTPLSSDAMDVPFWGDIKGGIGDDGLVAAFGFDNGTVSDDSGNNHVVTTLPQFIWHTPCVQITDGYIQTASSDALNPGGSAPFSILVWANPSSGTAPIACNGSSEAGMSVDVGSGEVTVNWSNGDSISAPWPSGWHHLALIGDGTNVRLLVDGAQAASQSLSLPSNMAANFIVAADLEGNRAWSLQLQGLSVWTTALTTDDVATYMAGGVPLGVSGCVGFLPFTDPADLGTGNAVTFSASTVSGTVTVSVIETPSNADDTLAAAASASATRPDAVTATDGATLLRLSDYRRLASALPQASVDASIQPTAEEAAIADAVDWYERFLTGLSPVLSARLRQEFASNLRMGVALASEGRRVGTFELRPEGAQTVVYYHTEQGPQEVGRLDEVLSPYLVWVATIFMDIAGIIAAMFGIVTTAAKVTKAKDVFEGLFEGIGAAAADVPAEVTNFQRACTAIWNVLMFLWEWKAFGSLVWTLIKASWWSVAFTVASIIAQVAAMVVTGGWLIAVKVAQMAVAIGNLVKDLLQMPPTAQATAAVS